MGARARIAQVVSDLFGFAAVRAAQLGASGSTELTIQESDDDVGGDSAELWGHGPLLYKPLVGSEVLYATLGSERVVLATKERRWQISVGDGEVVVRAMGGGSPARIHLKPDGSAVVTATSIKLGGDAASAFVALANLVDARIAAIVTWVNAHVHAVSGTTATAATPPLSSQSSVAATKVRAQ